MEPRAVIYVRISELTDATTAPERQEADARAWAEGRGLEVVAVRSDLDISGRRGLDGRPGLAQALADVETGAASVLVVARLDRLARSLVTFSEVVERVHRAGGSVASVAEALDFSTPSGRMVAGVLATFAAYESDMIGARVAAARRHLVAVGRWPGGRRPYGWRPRPLEGGGYELEVDEEEAAVLRAMAVGVLSGVAPGLIAADLNRRGVPTATGRAWAGGHSVRQVLEKPAVADLIGPAEYARVRSTLDRRQPARAKVVGQRLLGPALLKCGRCGSPMRAGRHGRAGYRYDVYRCTNLGAPGAHGCGVLAAAERVDETVEAEVLGRLGRFPLELATDGEMIDPAADERAELEAAMERLELDRYLGGLFAGDDGDRRFRAVYADLERRLADLPEPFMGAGQVLLQPAGPFAQAWAEAGLEERAAWLEAMLEEVVIQPGQLGRRFDRRRVALEWARS